MFIDKVESELGAGIFPLEMRFRPLGYIGLAPEVLLLALGFGKSCNCDLEVSRVPEPLGQLPPLPK